MEQKNHPIHFLKGLKTLSQEKIEKQLLKEKIDLYKYKSSEDNEVFFDLSQVEWVNLDAAFQLCLLVEKFIKNDYKVYIALPFQNEVSTEKNDNFSDNNYKSPRIKRLNAKAYLKANHFDNAVQCNHIKNKKEVLISDNFNFLSDKLYPNYFYSAFTRDYLTSKYSDNYYRDYIFPMTWISKSDEEYQPLVDKIEKVLSEEARGMYHIDILSLKNVIIYELLKNVKEHAGKDTKYALFAIKLTKSTAISKFLKFKSIEDNFLEGLVKSDINSIIEIYFGDTGDSICNIPLLEKYDKNFSESNELSDYSTQKKLIKWSFDKWSTQKNEPLRGTKGLYRIHRIINKYNGLIRVRSNLVDAGFQKGGYLIPKWIEDDKKKYFHPGTFIQIKLCPHKEILKYNLTVDERNKVAKDWKAISYLVDDKSINIEYFSEWFRGEITNSKSDNFIIIYYSYNQLKFDEVRIKFFEYSFVEVSKMRGDKGIILYNAITVGESYLEVIINSANERILKLNDDEYRPDNELIYDPILVIGENKRIGWYGGNQTIIKILNEMYCTNSPFPKEISDLESFKSLNKENQIEILKFFHNDSSFFTISKNKYLQFDFTNIISLYQEILKNEIKKKENLHFHNKSLICSPKLVLSEKWINFSKILNQTNALGFALTLFTLLMRNKFISDNNKLHLFIDHSQQYRLATELARLLGIKENRIVNLSEDIDNELPRRTRLFNEHDEVLILTTIIASTETIRRLIKQVRRDKGNIIAIVCVLNEMKNKDNTNLEIWGQKTPIYSILTDSNLKTKKEDLEYHRRHDNRIKSLYYTLIDNSQYEIFSPLYKPSNFKILNYGLTDELKVLFEKTSSFYYYHFGKYNGRHFTFYLHKEKILKNEDIAKAVAGKINKWKTDNGIQVTIHIVLQDKNYNLFSDFIKRSLMDDKTYKIISFNDIVGEVPTIDYIVFFDFSSLTGKTIKQIITSNICARKMLIITIFSQLTDGDINFFKNITQIKSSIKVEKPRNQDVKDEKPKNQNTRAPQLTWVSIDDYIDIERYIDVAFVSLYDLPVRFYDSIQCPVCQHRDALGYYMIKNSEHLRDIANKRKRRLKIVDSKDILPIPTDLFGDSENYLEHELSNKLICSMYFFKNMLENSVLYTESRIALFNKLYQMLDSIDAFIDNSDSEMYAFIYLLSSELIWLQKEPLIFSNFRYIVYRISKEISITQISELAKSFSFGIITDIGLNLAYRYKYAAISVFRASNKFFFCKEIFNIMKSSFYDNKFANPSLFHNILFHINSIHINEHNTSKVYFDDISKQLKLIKEGNFNFKDEQLEALYIIKKTNDEKIRKFELDNLSQLEIFIKLKDEVYCEYKTEKDHHPPILYCFDSLQLNKSQSQLIDVLANGKKAKSYVEVFKIRQDFMILRYKEFRTFLKNVILHIDALLSFKHSVLHSRPLKIFYTNYLEIKLNLQEFDKLITAGSRDILSIIKDDNSFNKYIKYYDRMKYFLFYDNIDNGMLSSDLKMFLDSIPSNLFDIVNSVFGKCKFKNKLEINIDKNIEVFVSKSILQRHLKLILENIKKRQNENYPDIKKTNNLLKCDIKIECNLVENFVRIYVVYSNTGNYKSYSNPNGSLHYFKQDLLNFNGVVDHGFLDNVDHRFLDDADYRFLDNVDHGFLDKDYYCVKITLLNYGG